MAEDQGVNGDRWTDEATRLFKKAGWQKIADSNIDIGGIGGKQHGIDSLFHYEDGFNPRMNQGVFLEAKNYSTSSLSKRHISEWIQKLADKIGSLRQSESFLQTYPTTKNLKMINGVIAIWFHDLDNYQSFKDKFTEYLESVELPIGRVKRSVNTRIFVLDNEKILRLASLLTEVENWNKNNKEGESYLKFYYPSSTLHGYSVAELSVINLEYIFSQFVFAKAKKTTGSSSEIVDIVFYFGDLDMNSFIRLSEALPVFDMIHRENDLIIYKYKRESDSFRKIKPDVIELFKNKLPKNVDIKNMEIFNDLPTWMTEDK